jgi:O-antigen/teichoic acid export membrane protein
MVEHFRKKLINIKNDPHMHELLSGAAVAFAIKVVAAGLAFGLNVVLARLLGAEGSGIFFLAFTIVLIVAVVGRVGMENSLVRFIAASASAKQPGKVLGVYQKAMLYSLVVAVFLSTLLYILAPWLSQVIFSKPELVQPLTIMAIAVVPVALLTLHANALQGLKKTAASISVGSVYIPLITCLISLIFVPKFGIDAAVWSYLLATIVTLLVGWWSWKRTTRSFLADSVGFDRSELLASSMPLYGVMLMSMIIAWFPMLFLGGWETSENVGIYAAASRTAMLTNFILVAVNSISAPKFAELYQQGDIDALGVVARNSAKIMVTLASPVLMLFLLIPERILSIFGSQFEQGATVLIILAAGQFVNVATGSVGFLLMMSGHEKIVRNNLFVCAVLTILLNSWLIPIYGITGAAVSAAIVLSVQNLILMVLVWNKMKIITLPWLHK